MAILKMINYKISNRESMHRRFLYCSDEAKLGGTKPITNTLAKSPEDSFIANKILHGGMGKKRLYKGLIISLEAEWPEHDKVVMKRKMLAMVEVVLQRAFGKKGFLVAAYLHCNTRHPHVHILVDTCNSRDGKQFSQSESELEKMKGYIGNILEGMGFGERIRNIRYQSEEELVEEEERESIVEADTEIIRQAERLEATRSERIKVRRKQQEHLKCMAHVVQNHNSPEQVYAPQSVQTMHVMARVVPEQQEMKTLARSVIAKKVVDKQEVPISARSILARFIKKEANRNTGTLEHWNN